MDKPLPSLVKLSASAEPIRLAIEWMLAQPAKTRPFVVIEEVSGHRFVQFVGDLEQPLKIDTGYQELLSPYRYQAEPCGLERAPAFAAQVLEFGLGLTPDDDVLVNPCWGDPSDPPASTT